MRIIKRIKPAGKFEDLKLKNIAVNDSDYLFLIFSSEIPVKKIKFPATRGKKKVNVVFQQTAEQETIIQLDEEEKERLIRFIRSLE